MMKASIAGAYVDEHGGYLSGISDEIWQLAELGLHEEKSAARLAAALAGEGFEVAADAGGMPSALVATWGAGRPVIGFLGEYDALLGLSQKASPVREPLEPGAAGHGCGHNLLGVGALGAAIGLKREIEARGIPGTVKYFGCPAEENFSGKSFIARDGLFSACDACLTWHPSSLNVVRGGSSLAVTSMNVTFCGRTAHAAAAPHHGRSALDAVQLMNLGVEFLREHMPPSSRVHYVVSSGGGQPNVVPAEACVWYYVRAPQRALVDELYERVLRCARGAAEMTETTFEVEILDAIWELLPNQALEQVLASAMARVGPPEFSPRCLDFAREIAAGFEPGQKESFLRTFFQDEPVPEDLRDAVLCETVVQRPSRDPEPRGSTDVGDVSWCCPTAQFGTACSAIGTPGHSWQNCAQAGMEIGHTGMLVAAKVLAEAGFELMTCPDALERARAEFVRRTKERQYRCALPEDMKPPFHVLAAKR